MIEREDLDKIIKTIEETEQDSFEGVYFLSEIKLFDFVKSIQHYAREDALKEIDDRLMPEGTEWPKFEDGEPVKVGDEFELNGKTVRIVCIHHAASSCYLNEAAGGQYYYDAPLKRPEPKQETLQDVIDDLYKQVPNQEFGHIIRVPIDLIGRLKAIQERMGGEESCQN